MTTPDNGAPPAFSPVGLPGERGQAGDPGAAGVTGDAGETGDTGARGAQGVRGGHGVEGAIGERGPAGLPGLTLPPQRGGLVLTLLSVAVVTLAMGLLFSLTQFARVNNDFRQLRAERACDALYDDDLDIAEGKALLALNDLIVSATARPAAITEAERRESAEANQRLGEVLDVAGVPLRVTITALEGYQALDPPPDECPHPEAQP